MRSKTIVAALLIGLGIAAFAYQANIYMTRGRDLSIGSMQMTTERKHPVPLPPIFGVIALIGGIAMLLVDKGDLKRPASVGQGPMGSAGPRTYPAIRDPRPLP